MQTTKMKNNNNLRKCSVSSHREYWVGFFHGLFTINDKVYAFVEGLTGDVHKIDMSFHSIKFMEENEK